MWRRPLLRIVNSGGTNIVPRLAGLWLSCKTTDNAGKESDTAELTCKGPPSFLTLPKKGDKFLIYMGWYDEGPVLQGQFTVQTRRAHGDPDSGDLITVSMRSADYVDKLKAQTRMHFEEGETFGDRFRKLAKRAGVEAVVDPDLDKIKLPYDLLFDQSPIDFAAEMGERHGAVVKPAGGKLIAMKRGKGASASGKDLEPILIKRRRGFGYDIELDERPNVGHVAAAWQDPKSGRRRMVKRPTGRDGPIRTLPHPFRSEEEANEAADAEAFESGNASGSGSFESPGLPKAFAEAPVIVSGYGELIDGRWKAGSIEKEITADGGFKTTVNVEAGKEQKGKSK